MNKIILTISILLILTTMAFGHGVHKAPWKDTNVVLLMVNMGEHEPSFDAVHAFYVDVNQDGICDRVILRSYASEHSTHVIYDDSYEKFLIEYGRYWALD